MNLIVNPSKSRMVRDVEVSESVVKFAMLPYPVPIEFVAYALK